MWGTVARHDRRLDGTGDAGDGVGSAGSVGSAPPRVAESVVRAETVAGSDRLLTWRWYWINGRLTTSDYVAKAYNALDKLTGRGDDSAVIVVTTPVGGPSTADAAATLDAFVEAAAPTIGARLSALHDAARQTATAAR